MIRLYCVGKLDATSFSIACYLASQAGAAGDGLKLYGLAPDKTGNGSSGRYARHLRRVLPQQASAPELDMVEVPVLIKGKRTT